MREVAGAVLDHVLPAVAVQDREQPRGAVVQEVVEAEMRILHLGPDRVIGIFSVGVLRAADQVLLVLGLHSHLVLSDHRQ